MPQEDLLAPALEIALEEGVEELPQHWVVVPRAPAHVLQPLDLGLRHAPVHGFQGRGIPRVHLAVGENHFGVRVGFDELAGEGDRGPVAHGLAVPEQLVPVGAGEGRTAFILGCERIHPEEGIGRVLNGRRHHMVGIYVTELLHCFSHSYLRLSVTLPFSFLQNNKECKEQT